MKILLKRHGAGLYPVGEEDRANMSQLSGPIQCTIKSGRKLMFHRKLFALIKLGFDNQDFYNDFEAYRFVLLLKTGHHKKVLTEKSKAVYMPISLSFEKTTQEKAEEVYRDILDYLIATLETDEETILNNLINFM